MHEADTLARIDIATLVPHQGAMCLWHRVLSSDDAHVVVATDSHRDAANPLRSDGRLRAVHLCEYGAQAMAVHGGLLALQDDAPVRRGFLVALRGVELHCTRFDDLADELTCRAELLMQSEASQQYGFRIEHAGRCIAEGRAAVMLQP